MGGKLLARDTVVSSFIGVDDVTLFLFSLVGVTDSYFRRPGRGLRLVAVRRAVVVFSRRDLVGTVWFRMVLEALWTIAVSVGDFSWDLYLVDRSLVLGGFN